MQGVIASLVFAELLVPLYRSGGPQAAAGLSDRTINFRNLRVITLTPEINMETARVRAHHGPRTPDAIHGATAIITQASGILTNDKRLEVLTQERLSVWLFDTDALEAGDYRLALAICSAVQSSQARKVRSSPAVPLWVSDPRVLLQHRFLF